MKPTDPVPVPGDYNSVAAQYARAKALKEQEDKFAKAQRARDAITRVKSSEFTTAWNWGMGFWIWMLFLHLAGIYFFTKGFLLTRLVLQEHSSCGELPAGSGVAHTGSPEDGCWHRKTFDKAVVVIIDALRYDFTVPYNGSNPGPYHNAIPFLYETAIREPHNAFLLPFIADPPTTTLQRLQGLTTGTLPTFIDAGSNFAGTAIEEDNILMQLRQAGRKIVHLGDDTWTALFPGYFEPGLSHAYDSLNVYDLHTVDNGVTEHIIPLLREENRAGWDVIFAHYLGVDHAGHRYGPNHPAMNEKLAQMDGVLRKMVATIDDDTLLVVMGDHGMDSKGDHGGESDDEVQASLWMYSRKGIFGRSDPKYVTPPQTAKERPVNQIDLVPTLSLLLGLPIPFNNLGRPIEEAFVGNKKVDWENLASVSQVTAAAIRRYQAKYYAARGIEENNQSGSPLALFDAAIATTSPDERYSSLSAYQSSTLDICRGLWARFDVPSMIQGVIILAFGVLVLLIYCRNVVDEDTRYTLTHSAQSVKKEVSLGTPTEDFTQSVVTGAYVGTAAGALLGFTAAKASAAEASFLNETLLGAAGLSLLGAFLAQMGSLKTFRTPLPQNIWTWLALIFTISQSIGFASNSYTIWEDSIVLYFLSTFGLLAALSSLRLRTPTTRYLGVYHSLLFTLYSWLSSLSTLCREEQIPFCRSTYYASSSSSTSAPWQIAIPFLVAISLPSLLKSYLTTSRSFEGFAPIWIGKVLPCALLAIAIFWLLEAADDANWFPLLEAGTLKMVRVVMARTVLSLALVGGPVAWAMSPPCVRIDILEPPTSSTAVTGDSKAPPAPTKPTVTILGYANAHGARYLLLYVTILVACLIVQKPMGNFALTLLTLQILSLLSILSLFSSAPPSSTTVPKTAANTVAITSTSLTTSKAQSSSLPSVSSNPITTSTSPSSTLKDHISSLPTSPLPPILLAHLATHAFFHTGHTATLSSIQWDSAFIPLYTITYPFSPLLVMLNTFGGYILCALAVPLVVVWEGGVDCGLDEDDQQVTPNAASEGRTEREAGGIEKANKRTKGIAPKILQRVQRALGYFLLFFAIENLATAMWAGHLRRHLMLYRVFSPRFMVGAVVLLVVDLIGILGTGMAVQGNIRTVVGGFGWSS